MNTPVNLKYTKNDEWVLVEGKEATLGITDYAQDKLSDIVYVEYLADVGENLKKSDACVTVESVKAAADVYIPVSGEVTSINEDLLDTPELINQSPYSEAWLLKISMSDPSDVEGLFNADEYISYCDSREH